MPQIRKSGMLFHRGRANRSPKQKRKQTVVLGVVSGGLMWPQTVLLLKKEHFVKDINSSGQSIYLSVGTQSIRGAVHWHPEHSRCVCVCVCVRASTHPQLFKTITPRCDERSCLRGKQKNIVMDVKEGPRVLRNSSSASL